MDNLKKYDSLPNPKYSKRHKRRINRIFREIAIYTKIPYPDVDNCFERTRSKLALKIPFLKIKSKIKKK